MLRGQHAVMAPDDMPMWRHGADRLLVLAVCVRALVVCCICACVNLRSIQRALTHMFVCMHTHTHTHAHTHTHRLADAHASDTAAEAGEAQVHRLVQRDAVRHASDDVLGSSYLLPEKGAGRAGGPQGPGGAGGGAGGGRRRERNGTGGQLLPLSGVPLTAESSLSSSEVCVGCAFVCVLRRDMVRWREGAWRREEGRGREGGRRGREAGEGGGREQATEGRLTG